MARSSIRLTDEQVAILDYARTGASLGIQAAAGTGKTMTLLAIITALRDQHPIQRMQYICFNTANANDSRRTLPPGAQVATFHSLAYQAYGHRFRTRLTSSTWPIAKTFQQYYAAAFPKLAGQRQPQTHVQAILQTLTQFCQSGDPCITPQHVPDAFLQAIPSDQQAPYAQQIAQLSQHAWDHWPSLPQWPITHDWYLKGWALQHPRLSADVILFDEAQDANPVMLHLIEEQAAQKIYAGDPYQQLYAWRGATDALQSVPHHKLPLQASWRYGTNLAKLANTILQPLAPEFTIRGRRDQATMFTTLAHPRAQVFRTNAGVLRAAIAAIEAGQHPHIVGGSQTAIQLLQAMQNLRPDTPQGPHPISHPDLAGIESWDELEEAQRHGALGSINPLLKWMQSHPDETPATIQALERHLVANEHDAQLILSTVHKAKGRQWSSVQLGDDFLPFATRDDPQSGVHLLREEIHCLYVGVTRAESALDWHGIFPTLQTSWALWKAPKDPALAPPSAPVPPEPTVPTISSATPTSLRPTSSSPILLG